jgi:prefoldin subunit 5
MDRELYELLARARQIKPTVDELEEQRIMIAAANGHLSDSRITVETMRAARTIMVAGASVKTKHV